MTPEFPYVQLPGTRRGFLRKASLWEGIDHILSVSGSRFADEYRRFYYRDIQALIVEKRPRAGSFGWWITLGVLLAFAIPAALIDHEWLAEVALGALLLIVAIRLESSLRRSCRCSIQTAVSREPLPSIIRRRDAERLISRLQTRIVAEQGELPAEIVVPEDAVAALVMPPDPALPAASQILEEAAKRDLRERVVRGVNYAVVAMFVLLLNSVFTFWVSSGANLFLPWTSRLGYLLIAAGLIPIFLALQNLTRLRDVKGLRILLIGMCFFSGLRVVMSWVSTPMRMGVARAWGQQVLPLFNRYYVNINGGLQLAVAAAGIILIFAKWDTYRRGEVSSD
jgi:hypothetical protein